MCFVKVDGGEEVAERKVFHQLVVLVDYHCPSASYIPKKKKRRPTEICKILQAVISNKTNSRMKPLCIHCARARWDEGQRSNERKRNWARVGGHWSDLRVGGTQDDDSCWETVVVRRREGG